MKTKYFASKGFKFGLVGSNFYRSKIFCRMLFGTKHNQKKILEGYYDTIKKEFVIIYWCHKNYIKYYNIHFIEDKLRYFLKRNNWI